MKDAVSNVSVYEHEDLNGDWEVAFALACVHVCAILGPMVVMCCIVTKCRQHCCSSVMILVSLGIELCLCIPVSVLSLNVVNKYEDREANFREFYGHVEGCSDAYTNVPEEVIEDLFQRPLDDSKIASILFNFVAALVYLKYIIILVLAICIKCKSGTEKQ